MNEYVSKWIQVTKKSNFQSTHQIVFGKAILDLLRTYEIETDGQEREGINRLHVATTMGELYCKQTFKYSLKQARGNSSILRAIDEYIEAIRDEYENDGILDNRSCADLISDAWWNRVTPVIEKIIKKDILNAFNNFKGESLDLVLLENQGLTISIRKDDARALKENYELLTKVYNEKWIELLSKYNDNFVFQDNMLE